MSALPQTPEDIAPAVADCWNGRDAEGFAALFAEDADFVNVVGLWWRKRRDIARAHAYGFERIFRHAEMEILEQRVRPLGEGHCVLHLRWRLSGQTTLEGEQAGVRQGVFILVAEQTDRGWQIVAAQNTDIIAGAETYISAESGTRPLSYR